MKTIGLTAALLLAAAAVKMPAAQEKNELPEVVRAVLEKPDALVLLSLNPERPDKQAKDDWYGWKVLGRTELKDAAARKVVADAVQKGVKDSDGTAAKCFEPRHGVHAVRGDKSVDLVICFECYQLHVYVNGKREGRTILTTRAPQAALDQILKDAKVPLPPGPKE